jgi:aspartate carbamoyltransferase
MPIKFHSKDIISAKQFTREDLDMIFEIATSMEPVARGDAESQLLRNKYLATLFFESSTRTRFSFEIAMLRLGGQIINTSHVAFSSITKGESLHDTAKVVGNFVDIIAIRHPQVGSALTAAKATERPVINAGDGPGEHPTQALLDLFTILKEKKRIDGLKIAMAGDLKFGRTIHSLAHLLAHFDVEIIFVSPEILRAPEGLIGHLKEKGVAFRETDDLEETIGDIDVLYDTRIQEERFTDLKEFEKVKNCYTITKELVGRGKEGLSIMHPLPRLQEISVEVDDLPNAAYFRQTFYGVPIRMALLALLLGKA